MIRSAWWQAELKLMVSQRLLVPKRGPGGSDGLFRQWSEEAFLVLNHFAKLRGPPFGVSVLWKLALVE